MYNKGKLQKVKAEQENHQKILRNVVELIKAYQLDSPLLKDIEATPKVRMLGAGKASVQLAKNVIIKNELMVEDGIVISNSGCDIIPGVQVFEGSHPYPDSSSVSASYELLNLARKTPKGETVIFCLSGGASSLLSVPPNGIEIEELAETYRLLLTSGAPIQEINIVRKHLCMLKGGQLAQTLHHVNLITLIVSDVPKNDVETIGSAPTICDSSTFKDAFQILKRYELWNKIPHSVRIHIASGMGGDIPDTPKPGINDHPNHRIKLVSNASSLADQIENILKKKGLHTWVADSAYNENIKKTSKMVCSKAISVLSNNDSVKKPAALIFYGESSINVKGKGKGGRNQELALAVAISIEGQHSISVLSIGTDGINGDTDAAGAIIDSYTILKARKKKLDPEAYLQNNDSYHFHRQMESLIKIGPTGNNVMDLQVVLIE